ncbi:MAG: sulfite exporter TauE/SafE family protein [Acidobacteriota bacterium]
MPHLTLMQWLLAIIAAAGIGLAKAGFAGVGLVHVLIFAFLFGARSSTGVVLPMLLVGDVLTVRAFRQHAQWEYVRRMLPPACIGVVGSAALISHIDETTFKPMIGWIILVLSAMQLARAQRPEWFAHVPHSRLFTWTIGLLAGTTTMLANAAGPVFALYGLAVGLPKLELVGTSAWLFLAVNAFKVPFSVALGLIHWNTLLLNVVLAPAIVAGNLAGRWLTARLPQRLFDNLLLAFAAIAALKLVIGW